MPAAVVLIADGTEEMEFVITVDVLVRAGIQVTSAFVSTGSSAASESDSNVTATCSRGVKILADKPFEASHFGPDKFDLVVVPGGAKGAETISRSSDIQALIGEFNRHGKLIGMICAGSLAAQTSGLPKQSLTSHPSVKNQLSEDYIYQEDSVVVSNNLITSRGPGTAFPFALTLVELLLGKDKREEVKGPMVFGDGTPF